MRTPEEIAARVEALKDSDVFGFERQFLVPYLPFEHARPFLKEGTTADHWGQPRRLSRDAIIAEMRNYMPFAWEKANNCRGISAYRTMVHYKVWLWLLGGEDAEFIPDIDEEYEYYGKPHLRAICERFGFESGDDGIWRNSADDDGIPAPEGERK